MRISKTSGRVNETFSSQQHEYSVVKAAFLSFFCVLLVGCIGSREIEAPEAYLSSAGWQNNQAFLKEKTFADYANAVKDEVHRYRIPFNPEQTDIEVEMASPIELPLSDHCAGRANGIAILVHGLSDTAFSMRDIGGVLADVCFKSRVILLPGHGTRAGDLLTTRFSDWRNTIDYLIDQAAAETNTIVLAGFSMGGVLTLDAALRREDVIDGVIGLSPAYHLSSSRLARWTPILTPFIRWVDRGVADDPMRYEAMPMRGIAETWSAMQQMNKNLDKSGAVNVPWMLIQSMDDAVIEPVSNEQLWKSHAANPLSRLIRFVSHQQFPDEEKTITLSGISDVDRVLALNHLAIHQSPDNPLYGRNGSYRNCGGNMPRDKAMVMLCEQSDTLWYGLWESEVGEGQALAYSTFNPGFGRLAKEITEFVGKLTDSR